MDGIKEIFLGLLCFLFFTCTNSDEHQLIGHWHIEVDETKSDVVPKNRDQNSIIKKATFDFDGRSGVWNKSGTGFQELHVRVNFKQKELRISSSDCFNEVMIFETWADLIRIISKNWPLEYSGYRCSGNFCNKQNDRFLNVKVDIDLPEVNTYSRIQSYHIDPNFERPIYVGLVRPGCWGNQRMFAMSLFLIKGDIKHVTRHWNFLVHKEIRSLLKYVIYADKSISTKLLKNVYSELVHATDQQIYFALRDSTDLSDSLCIRLLEIDKELYDNLDKYEVFQDLVKDIDH